MGVKTNNKSLSLCLRVSYDCAYFHTLLPFNLTLMSCLCLCELVECYKVEQSSSGGDPRENESKIRSGSGSQRMFLLFAMEPDIFVLPPDSQVKCVDLNTLLKLFIQQDVQYCF